MADKKTSNNFAVEEVEPTDLGRRKVVKGMAKAVYAAPVVMVIGQLPQANAQGSQPQPPPPPTPTPTPTPTR